MELAAVDPARLGAVLLSVSTSKVTARSGGEVLVRTGQVRFSTVLESDLGRYYLGRTGLLAVPARSEALVVLSNPPSSTKRLFVVAITATTNLGRRVFFTFDVATTLPTVQSTKLANAHRGSVENRQGVLEYVVAPTIPLHRGEDVFERLLQGNQTLVVEQEGRLILEPGSNIAFYFPAVDNPDELDVASGWWEEPLT